MENRYAVYFDHRKILFLPELPDQLNRKDTVIKDAVGWDTFKRFIDSEKSSLLCVSDNPSRMFRHFATFFHYIEAAGGLVADPTGYWLFIFRKSRWDLPKGKMEKDEPAEDAAIREVQEECGIGNLEVLHSLPKTYHVYPYLGDQWALKKTHWFFMKTSTCCRAEPQTSEGIIRAEWKHPDHLSEVMSNTYGNIKELLALCRQLTSRS